MPPDSAHARFGYTGRALVGGSVRIATIVLGALLLCPLIGAFLHPEVAWSAKFLFLTVLASSVVSPRLGFVATVLVLPFSSVLAIAGGGRMAPGELTDALAMAFAAGASLGTLRDRSSVWTGRLVGPALVLLAAVGTSAIVEIHTLQSIAPRRPVAYELWHHLTRDYWLTPREFPFAHHTLRWMSWIIGALHVERLVAAAGPRKQVLCRIWIVAGITGALLGVEYAFRIALASGVPTGTAILDVLRGTRVSALQPDVNAAGSYFVLFLVPAIVVAVRRRSAWLVGAAATPLAVGLLLARSRAAIAAAVLVLWAASLMMFTGSQSGARRKSRLAVALLGSTVLVAVAAIGMLRATARSNIDPRTAFQVRVEMLSVGLESVRRHPAFGVGLGDYITATRRFVTPDTPLLFGYAPGGENAHNNYLQIVVELGVPAAVVFLWLVLPTAIRGVGSGGHGGTSPEAQGMALGLGAFLVSALLGHPLLVPLVGASFFLALGLSAGLADDERTLPRVSLVAGAIAFYVLSLGWRLT